MAHSACGDGMQVHFLDETRKHAWGLLRAVKPIFTSKECNWMLKHDEGQPLPPGYLREAENEKFFFKDELKRLPVDAIKDALACHNWDHCVRTLADTLNLLESIVKEDILSESDKTKQSSDELQEAKPTIYSWFIPYWFSFTTPNAHILNAPSVQISIPPSNNQLEFPKLAALVELTKRGDFGTRYLNTELPIQIYKKREVLELFSSFVEAIAQPRPSKTSESLEESSSGLRFATTNWKTDAPSKACDRLHKILRTHIGHCRAESQRGRHEILLKMLGSRFEQMSFQAVVIPCYNNAHRRQVRFSAQGSPEWDRHDPRKLALTLCNAIEQFQPKTSRDIPSFLFEHDGDPILKYISSDCGSQLNISIDKTLRHLQTSSPPHNTKKDNIFGTRDKTILELTLAQSLLHLLRSPWSDLPWNAESIRFLQDHDLNNDLDVHHPYVAYLLQPVADLQSAFPDDEGPSFKCIRIMSSFAQLLLEIESGRAVEFSNSVPMDIKMMIDYLMDETDRRDQTNEVRSRVQSAINGCLKFGALLSATCQAASKPNDNLDYHIRETVYRNIIQHLEKNLAIVEREQGHLSHQDPKAEDRVPMAAVSSARDSQDHSPLSEDQSGKMHMQMHRNDRRRIKVAMFDSKIYSKSGYNAQHAAVAHGFWDKHQRFYDEYIKPKAQLRSRNSRRTRIAILDTGIDKLDSFVRRTIDDITTARWQRAIQDFKQDQQGDRPKKDSFSPIKGIKNFVQGSKSIQDTCGHGTATAGLLLRVAPDTDIYIAKVSDGLKFEDTTAVAKAIEWAAEKEVDILSMSFGTRSRDDVIERALKSYPDPLMFAAASNGGTGVPTAYPAFDYRVFAINALSGDGDEGSMNPTAEANSSAFGTLGYGVETTWQDETRFVNGTSYSTPIAAGIVANYLEWVDYVARDASFGVEASEIEHWRSKNTIPKVLKHLMSHRKNKLDFIMPWLLWQPTMTDPDNHVISTLRNDWRVNPSLE